MKMRVVFAGLFLLAGVARAQTNIDVSRYAVSKNGVYVQTSLAAPTFNTYFFEAFVDPKNGGTLTAGTVQANDFTYTLTDDNGSRYYADPARNTQTTYPTQSSLDSYYAGGTHTFTITGTGGNVYSADLELSGDVYPTVVPTITNTTWSGGRLALDALSANTFTFNTFANMDGATHQDAIVLTLEGTFKNGVVGYEFLTRDPSNSFSLDADTMIEGNIYTATLGFLKIVDGYEVGDTGAPIFDAQGLAFYSFQTKFEVQAIPEPSTYVLTALGLGLIVLPWARRRFVR